MMKFLPLGALLLGLAAAPAVAADMDIVKEMGLRETAIPNWQKPKKVVFRGDNGRVAFLREVVKDPSVNIVAARTVDEFKAAVVDADVILGIDRDCAPDVIPLAKKVRWLQTGSAGNDGCLVLPRVQSGEAFITNMQRVAGPLVADHAMALMLGLARRMPTVVEQQRAHESKPYQNVGLTGKTLLVVGLGGIGTDIAKRAYAFDMRVIATRNTGREGPDYVSYVGTADELPKLIGEADFVINVTPLTPATTGMFNREIFARMKPSAFFVNVGRGKSVNTMDLVAALQKKQLAGAGLDVTDPEPLPKDHPLWDMPNVILTPHMAMNMEERTENTWMVMRENLRRYVAGEKMLSVVDTKRGY